MLSVARSEDAVGVDLDRRTLRILVVHSHYASGSSSGENRVVEDEVALLRAAGHHVELWSPEPATATLRQRAGAAAGAVWNRAAVASVTALIRDTSPDVLHVHNLFPAVSPAVLRVDIPTVVTLHNYRMLCLPAVLLRDGVVCEDCVGKLPWRGVVHRCYRGSALGSAALGTSLALHRRAGSFDRVGTFLAVSEFVREKHIQAGFDPDRIVVQPNFVQPMERRSGPGEYFLFLGRLSHEKGLDRLLPQWGDVPAKLIVVGEGEERDRLGELARGDVEFRGAVDPSRVSGLLGRARALVLPSICYEGAPRTVVEAFAAGVPVIANALGGLPGVVREGSGLLVPPGDPRGWVDAANRLLDDDTSQLLGAGAYREWQSRFSPEQAVTGLENAYNQVIRGAEAAGTAVAIDNEW
jgi:glycosyltransferase involved in cell wall biosynthesis